MRHWYKYSVTKQPSNGVKTIDETPADHARSMGGFLTERGYTSKEDFFQTHFISGGQRYKIYYDYITRHFKKDGAYLSAGCGRAALELKLMEEGYKLILSDVEQYCKNETMRIFPNINFVKFDLRQGPFPQKFDGIFVLGICYLFNPEELAAIFSNLSQSLKPKGRVLIDLGGSEDNFLTYCIDDIVCPLENRLKAPLNRLRNRQDRYFSKKQHGYRLKNDEVKKAAEKNNFRPLAVTTGDYLSEFSRSRLLTKLPEGLRLTFGRNIPYVRLFDFEKV